MSNNEIDLDKLFDNVNTIVDFLFLLGTVKTILAPTGVTVIEYSWQLPYTDKLITYSFSEPSFTGLESFSYGDTRIFFRTVNGKLIFNSGTKDWAKELANCVEIFNIVHDDRIKELEGYYDWRGRNRDMPAQILFRAHI